jgi:hypothetical protein
MQDLDLINQQYLDQAIDVYPFISKNRVTVLRKGLYTKKKTDYRGVSFRYNTGKERYTAILVGFYNVPKNYVIVPEGLTVTEGKRKLIQDKMRNGYELITTFPSLHPLEFPEGSEEYEIAQYVHEEFKARG